MYGLAIATLLSQNDEVVAVDISKERIELTNKRISHIKDPYIEEFFSKKNLNLLATDDYRKAFDNAKYIIICTQTDFNEQIGQLDTKSIEQVIQKVVDYNSDATIIIKSTVPIGFTEQMRNKYDKNIIFCPEFLREGSSLYDMLYPSRIVIGDKGPSAIEFADILKNNILKKDVDVQYTNSNEAEAIKIFSNAYLAMRIAFFNELDTFAKQRQMNTKEIIDGVTADERIGKFYNNPSFGYGGYCLPKDTKQLLKSYKEIPQSLIGAIIESNMKREQYIANEIKEKKLNTIGIYRLQTKKNSDNIRNSAILEVVKYLKGTDSKIVIYEPLLKDAKTFNGYEVVNSLDEFFRISDIIVANRMDDTILKYKDKLYTRDIYEIN